MNKKVSELLKESAEVLKEADRPEVRMNITYKNTEETGQTIEPIKGLTGIILKKNYIDRDTKEESAYHTYEVKYEWNDGAMSAKIANDVEKVLGLDAGSLKVGGHTLIGFANYLSPR